jgi:parvulin-like peptidyl-prolyl isomerase
MPRKGFSGKTTGAGSRKARLGMVLGGLAMVAVCIAVRYYWGNRPAKAAAPGSRPGVTQSAAGTEAESIPKGSSTPSAIDAVRDAPIPDIVAAVNGRQITRQELAQECLRHHGKEILESMTNKYLIFQECQRLKIAVSRTEINEEIDRMARRFGLPADQWLKLLKAERGIKPEQYANDIIWPTLALRKLAGDRLNVSRDEVLALFESEYGAAVCVRLIACSTRQKAEQVCAQATAKPETFGDLAKTHSEDAPSASIGGLIQPIRKHSGSKAIEQAAFSMADGDVSKVIEAGGQFVILKRERALPPRSAKLEVVYGQLEEVLRERKMRTVAGEIFADLQKRSTIDLVYGNSAKMQQMPGVAAVINGAQITLGQLAEECLVRHATDVLDGTIDRRLLESACKQKNVTVSEKELDAEITHLASIMEKPLPDKSPDVQKFLKRVAQQGMSVDLYRREVIWPSVALKKLVGDKFEITQEDMKKGFEANYGPRVRCRAIVMDNLRRAQEVWDLARKNPALDYFGELAAKYSIEAASRSMKGEVPPIQKHGGQPALEEEAFRLKPGELSGVIQVEDKYVILFCEGFTKSTEITFEQVRDVLYEDIREKKQRVAMAEYFDKLQAAATIDNFLVPRSKSPQRTASRDTTPGRSGSPAVGSVSGGK